MFLVLSTVHNLKRVQRFSKLLTNRNGPESEPYCPRARVVSDWRASWFWHKRGGIEGPQPPPLWRHTIMASGPSQYLTGDVFRMNNTFVSWHRFRVLDNGFCCFNLYRMRDATARPATRLFYCCFSFLETLFCLLYKREAFFIAFWVRRLSPAVVNLCFSSA